MHNPNVQRVAVFVHKAGTELAVLVGTTDFSPHDPAPELLTIQVQNPSDSWRTVTGKLVTSGCIQAYVFSATEAEYPEMLYVVGSAFGGVLSAWEWAPAGDPHVR